MPLRTRRTVYYLALVVATTMLFTLVYNVGMATWEGRPQPLYRSLEVVIQSFTTTGYGEDAPWRTPQMNLLAITMQLAGIGLILTAVDVFAVPWLRDALTPSAPESAGDLRDHVIVCGHTPRTDAFVSELDARGRPYVLVEPDTRYHHSMDMTEDEVAFKLLKGEMEDVHTRYDESTAAEETLANLAVAGRATKRVNRRMVGDVDTERSVARLLDWGFIDGLEPTPLGRAVTEHFLAPSEAFRLLDAIRRGAAPYDIVAETELTEEE